MRNLLILFILLTLNSPAVALSLDYGYKFKLDKVDILLEVAQSLEEKIKGLMHRNSLKENTGMVFLYDDYFEQSFWMKNVKIPLDIVFINDEKIVKIYKNVPPHKEGCYCRVYHSGYPVNKVIELNGGFCEKHSIKEGQEIKLKRIKKCPKNS